MRAAGRNWDDYTQLHPDERFLSDMASKVHDGPNMNPAARSDGISIDEHYLECYSVTQADYGGSRATRFETRAANGHGGYFDALCSDLNVNVVHPTIYVYGEYPIFSTRVLAESYAELTDDNIWQSYINMRLVGRTMSSVADTIVILLVFLIGARLFGRFPGLLAATFYTFAAFPIQQSHFWTADAFTNLWVVMTIYFAVRILDRASTYRERFGILPWAAIGISLWLYNLTLLDDADKAITVESLGFVLAIFMGLGLWNTYTAERKQLAFGVLGTLVGMGLVLFEAFAISDWIMSEAAIAIALTLIPLSAVWNIGYYRIAGVAGFFPWLAAAYGMWVYDSLANYGYDENYFYIKPDVTILAAYLLFFTAVGLLTGGWQRFTKNNPLENTMIVAVPFFILIGALALAAMGGISMWGAIVALGLAVLLGGSTVAGLREEVAFGLAFGSALAGRVNVLPLVGLIFLALLLRALIIIDWRVYSYERNQRFGQLGAGLFVAGVATILVFRFLQPHAFMGPTFFGITPNAGWLDDIAQARHLVSGDAEIPPNWQWTNRVPWLFPLQNIVMYGLGLPLGIAAWGAALWAVIRIARGRQDWTRLAIPAAWLVVYFGWLGQNWVTTMRYFLVLYGVLAIFAAWGLTELMKQAYRVWQVKPQKLSRRLAFASAVLALLLVLGHTLIYGYGFTHIHRTQLTRVATARYAQEFVPGDVGIYIDTNDGRTRMVNLAVYTIEPKPNIQIIEQGQDLRIALTPSYTANLTGVALHFLSDSEADDAIERIRLSAWAIDAFGAEQLISAQLIEEDLNTDASYGQEYFVEFDPAVPIYLDENGVSSYELRVEVLEGGAVTLTAGIFNPETPEVFTDAHMTAYYTDQFSSELQSTQQLVFEQSEGFRDVAYMSPGSIHDFTFEAHTTGTIQRLVIPHLSDPLNDSSDETLDIVLTDGINSVMGTVTGDFNTVNDGHLLYGPSVSVLLDEPLAVESGRLYTILLEPRDYLGIAGSAVAWEGAWDDPMPTVVCPIPNDMFYSDDLPSGMCDITTSGVNLYTFHYIGLTMNMAWPDEPEKRDDTLNILNQTDYIFIGSNRFYDSFNRIPSRWPMSNDYYEALFSGELGFELVKTFESYAEFGPFEWQDQILPSESGLFNWRNEYEAEEAFHVYDHPVVFIFRKTAAYSPSRAAETLGTPLLAAEDVAPTEWFYSPPYRGDPKPINRLRWPSKPASESPTALMYTEDELAIQREGGTWSDLFNRASILNENQGVAVGVWWFVMLLMGWVTFPLMHWILPGLPDRGFGMAKLVGWLVIAWVAWFGASMRLEIWTQTWLIIMFIGFAAINGFIAYSRRSQLLSFIRKRWVHLLFLEVLATILYLAFVGVRLGNPDLWHNYFGGEKPMNMAYFNAVLRSTIFPPIDPWFSGGYINYYYWGYVLVGAPTKIIGIVPQIAYNLILPTLFSMSGMGAFSIAYNIVQWTRERRTEVAKNPKAISWREKLGPLGDPYVAGITALMLAVVLGNLGTAREFTRGLAQIGGWSSAEVYEQQLYNAEYQNFVVTNGREPSPAEQQAMLDDVSLNNFEATQKWATAVWDGLSAVSKGEQTLGIAAHRWYWGPTRIIAELSDGRGFGAINEMPYFTFLYGDMHAHMMAMPLTLLVILILTSEILGAGRRLRGLLPGILAILLLGMTAGLLRPTNTWDWPTYMILSVAGLTFAAWVGQGRLQSNAEPLPLFERLRQYLDLRYMLKLWPLLIVVPVGIMLYVGLITFERNEYAAKDRRGEIPAVCKEIDPDVNIVPDYCEGNFEPKYELSGIVTASVGALAAVAILYAAGLVILGNRFDRDGLLAWVARIMTFGLMSVFAIYPYMSRYATAYGEILPWENAKTPQWAYLTMHGVFLFIIFSFLVWQTARWLANHTVRDLRGFSVPTLAVVGAIGATILASLYFGFGEYPIFLIALPLMVWSVTLFLFPDQSNVMRWVYMLIGLAVGLTMAVEVVVLQGDIGRQNTVFKFYIQAWFLFSISSGVVLSWMVYSISQWKPIVSGIWQVGLSILLSLALLFTITATQGRWQDRFNSAETPLTLDGIEFMKYATHSESGYIGPSQAAPIVEFNLNGDYYLIRWMQDNVEGSPTIIEGAWNMYRWTSRVSIHTGLPTVFGWHFHQLQQRNLTNFDRIVTNRMNNVRAFYETTRIQEAWDLIEFYDIEYIVVGSFERIIHSDVLPPNPGSDIIAEREFRTDQSPGFRKFDDMVELGLIEVVYARDVCIHPTIFTAEGCPEAYLSTDYVYRVVDGVDFNESSVVQVIE